MVKHMDSTVQSGSLEKNAVKVGDHDTEDPRNISKGDDFVNRADNANKNGLMSLGAVLAYGSVTTSVEAIDGKDSTSMNDMVESYLEMLKSSNTGDFIGCGGESKRNNSVSDKLKEMANRDKKHACSIIVPTKNVLLAGERGNKDNCSSLSSGDKVGSHGNLSRRGLERTASERNMSSENLRRRGTRLRRAKSHDGEEDVLKSAPIKCTASTGSDLVKATRTRRGHKLVTRKSSGKRSSPRTATSRDDKDDMVMAHSKPSSVERSVKRSLSRSPPRGGVMEKTPSSRNVVWKSQRPTGDREEALVVPSPMKRAVSSGTSPDANRKDVPDEAFPLGIRRQGLSRALSERNVGILPSPMKRAVSSGTSPDANRKDVPDEAFPLGIRRQGLSRALSERNVGILPSPMKRAVSSGSRGLPNSRLQAGSLSSSSKGPLEVASEHCTRQSKSPSRPLLSRTACQTGVIDSLRTTPTDMSKDASPDADRNGAPAEPGPRSTRLSRARSERNVGISCAAATATTDLEAMRDIAMSGFLTRNATMGGAMANRLPLEASEGDLLKNTRPTSESRPVSRRTVSEKATSRLTGRHAASSLVDADAGDADRLASGTSRPSCGGGHRSTVRTHSGRNRRGGNSDKRREGDSGTPESTRRCSPRNKTAEEDGSDRGASKNPDELGARSSSTGQRKPERKESHRCKPIRKTPEEGDRSDQGESRSPDQHIRSSTQTRESRLCKPRRKPTEEDNPDRRPGRNREEKEHRRRARRIDSRGSTSQKGRARKRNSGIKRSQFANMVKGAEEKEREQQEEEERLRQEEELKKQAEEQAAKAEKEREELMKKKNQFSPGQFVSSFATSAAKKAANVATTAASTGARVANVATTAASTAASTGAKVANVATTAACTAACTGAKVANVATTAACTAACTGAKVASRAGAAVYAVSDLGMSSYHGKSPKCQKDVFENDVLVDDNERSLKHVTSMSLLACDALEGSSFVLMYNEGVSDDDDGTIE